MAFSIIGHFLSAAIDGCIEEKFIWKIVSLTAQEKYNNAQ